MKKIFTFWAFLMLVAIGMQAAPQLPRFAQQNLGPAPEQAYVPVGQHINIGGPSVNQLPASSLNDDDASIYAFQVYASYGALHGWYNIQAHEPWNYELVKDFGDQAGDYGIAAATYANGKTIAYIMQMYGSREAGWTEILMPVGLAVLDEKTGEFELKYNTQSFHQMEYGQTFNELTYDPTTDKIYAKEFAFDADGNWIADRMNVYEINPNTLEPTYVGQLDDAFLTMAAHDGMVYGIVQTLNNKGYVNNTILKKADMSATVDGVFQSSVVAYMPEGGAYDYTLSTMEFDHTTHRLWWLGYKNSQPILAEVDTKKAQLSHLNVLQRNAKMLGLTIPYQTAPAQAPAQVRNLVVTPAANGVGEATITWENPSWNYNRETLSDLKGVKIYRDGEWLMTIGTPTIGASNTYRDTNVPRGMHNYKLVAYNSAGDGLAKEYEVYIGEDVPGYIINLQATPNADEVTLSWIAPAEGFHQGWYDTASVVYDVYRGTYKVADGISETSFTDKVNNYGYYRYKVIARTDVGSGPESEVSIAFGPAMELPYENDLSEAELGAELTVIDGNGDGNTWRYNYGYKAMQYITSLEHKADDFLVLPPVNLTAGKKYELNFSYFGSNYTDTYELLNVVVGQGATKEQLSTIVEEFYIEAGNKGAKWYTVKAQYIAPEDGVYNFAFHCISEPYMGFLEINNISLHEMDITLDKAEVSLKATETVTLVVTVLPETASNRGIEWSSSDESVAVVDENGVVTAIALGEAIITATTTDGSDLSASCKVTVVPTLAETITLDKIEISLEATETATLIVTVLPELTTDKSVEWSSSDESVATIDANGLVTAIAVGEAIITAATTDGSDLSATCKVTVVPTLAESITLDKTEISLEATETATLLITVLPELATDKSVEWSSSNESIATVDENGVVTAVAVGEATITATTVDDSNLSATCKVTVIPTLAVSIELDQTEASVEEKSDLQLTATILPEHATNKEVAWSSSDKWVATVDNTGLVTIHSAGEVIITATTTDGTNLSATCRINVYSGIDGVNGDNVIVATVGNNIVVKNAQLGSNVRVYAADGSIITSEVATDGDVVIEAPVKGIYIVAIDGKSFKVMVK